MDNRTAQDVLEELDDFLLELKSMNLYGADYLIALFRKKINDTKKSLRT